MKRAPIAPVPATPAVSDPMLPGTEAPRPSGRNAGKRRAHGTPHIRHNTNPGWTRDTVRTQCRCWNRACYQSREGIPDCCGPTDHAGSTVHPRKSSRPGPPPEGGGPVYSPPNFLSISISNWESPARDSRGPWPVVAYAPTWLHWLFTKAPRSANGVARTRPRPPRWARTRCARSRAASS